MAKYLETLDACGSRPSLHVNGSGHSSAVVVVDFGTPLGGVTVNQETIIEMSSRMKKLTQELISQRAKVSFHADAENGIYWTSTGGANSQ